MTELTSVTLKNQSTTKGKTLGRQVLALRCVQHGTEWLLHRNEVLFLCVCMSVRGVVCNNNLIVNNSAVDLENKNILGIALVLSQKCVWLSVFLVFLLHWLRWFHNFRANNSEMALLGVKH